MRHVGRFVRVMLRDWWPWARWIGPVFGWRYAIRVGVQRGWRHTR